MAKKAKRKLTKEERKIRRRLFWTRFLISIIVIGLIGLAAGGTIIYTMIKSTSVTLDVTDFQSAENTLIYDRTGEMIGKVGTENRINITYADLPQVLVDAFAAVEDSRFFEHNGFDIPRFVKSALENVISMSFAQGGSTLTMQMIKNTYFVTEDQLAPATIDRKVQEIYLAIKVETLISKKKIFEHYINKINFGGTARGVQAGSLYYFGKDVSQINISEAAVLAGVINAPSDYDPYYNVDWCTSRRNDVLYQMYNHGYITEEQMRTAMKVEVQNLLVGADSGYDGAETTPVQSYIDAVLNEVEEITGEDPYTTPMRIYTAMDPYVQQVADEICQGKNIVWPNPWFQCGFAVVNNHNGEIVALGGGRGRTGERVYSYATDSRKSPGSSIKPIIDYALAFNYAGISSADHVLDKKIQWEYTTIDVYNSGGVNFGMIPIEEALIKSLNIPAIIELRKVRAAVKDDSVIINYLKQLGYDEDIADNFNEQYAIGGAGLEVSPLQMAGAQAMLFNNGVYNEPHTITRIEFIGTNEEPYIPTYTGVQVLKPAAAYLTTNMMYQNVNNDYYLGSFRPVSSKPYAVYGKTGSSDWGDGGLQYGIPRSAMRDHWMNLSTGDFSIATWTGYDLASADHISYFTTQDLLDNHVAQIGSRLLDALQISYGTPAAVANPGGLKSETFVKGTWPYLAPPSWCPKEYIVSGSSINASVGAWPTPTIEQCTGFETVLNSADTEYDSSGKSTTTISIEAYWAEYPGKKTDYKDGGSNGIPSNYFKEEVDGKIQYVAEVYLDGNVIASSKGDKYQETLKAALTDLSVGTHVVQIYGYYAYANAPVQCDPIIMTLDFYVPENPHPVVPVPDPGPVDPVNPEQPGGSTPQP